MSFESPDGRTLYFIHLSRENGVWKMPVEGGEAVQVTGPLNDVFNFAVGKDGIFYSAAPDSRHQGAIQFLSFSTGKMRPVVWTDHPLGAGLSLSPDQRFLLFSLREQTNSDLMMIENFVVR